MTICVRYVSHLSCTPADNGTCSYLCDTLCRVKQVFAGKVNISSGYVEYSCNSYNRYGKQHCTPHRIHESQIDKLVIEELSQWREKIISESDKYDKIVREWVHNRPIYEQKIKQYNDKILILKNQIEEIIMERISDREHAEVYNNMISKREEQISDLEKKISDAQLRTLVHRISVHQNEDKSLDVRLEFNGDFEDSVSVYVEESA